MEAVPRRRPDRGAPDKAENIAMPELPEVETVRRGLAPVMEGAVISKAEIRRKDLRFPLPRDLGKRLTGARVLALSRRAKFLLADLDTGQVLVMHLGMSGSFRVHIGGDPLRPGNFHFEKPADRAHDHVVFHLDRDGCASRVVYNDPRRFGSMDLVDSGKLINHFQLARLGLEPTGNALDGSAIAAIFAGRKISLKSALLDQRLIAGLGNIYACEALWEAGLSPIRSAGSISDSGSTAAADSERLALAIRDVLARAVAAGGSSLRDHRLTDGTLGYFQNSFAVYEREGEACARAFCHGVVTRLIQSGRSTYYCPRCQR
jgi:formamidopyrimidine-DNA glycosylase